MKRRSLLSLTVLTGASAFLGGCSADERQPALAFTNRLGIPPPAEPLIDPDGAKRFTLTLGTGETELLPGKITKNMWGVNGSYLGPVVRVERGDRVRMQVVNRLPEATTLHWHGMRLPARMDGGPHRMIEPGATQTPEWTVDQPATTSWFHPHPHERTAMHVYRGVAGLFLIDDPDGPELPSAYGVDDIPLIVQDKVLDGDGQLETGASPPARPSSWTVAASPGTPPTTSRRTTSTCSRSSRPRGSPQHRPGPAHAQPFHPGPPPRCPPRSAGPDPRTRRPAHGSAASPYPAPRSTARTWT